MKHGCPEPWYHREFCHGTTILVNLDKAPEVDKWVSKSGSRINNHLLTYTPYTLAQ